MKHFESQLVECSDLAFNFNAFHRYFQLINPLDHLPQSDLKPRFQNNIQCLLQQVCLCFYFL